MRALVCVFDDNGEMVSKHALIEPSVIKYVDKDGIYQTIYTFTFEARKLHCFTRKEDNYGTCEEKENSEE